MTESDPSESTAWFVKARNVRRIVMGLGIACGLLVVLDIILALAGVDKHPHFGWERWPAFYAVFGFVMCSLLVLASRFILRPLVMRDENYYERKDASAPVEKTDD